MFCDTGNFLEFFQKQWNSWFFFQKSQMVAKHKIPRMHATFLDFFQNDSWNFGIRRLGVQDSCAPGEVWRNRNVRFGKATCNTHGQGNTWQDAETKVSGTKSKFGIVSVGRRWGGGGIFFAEFKVDERAVRDCRFQKQASGMQI